MLSVNTSMGVNPPLSAMKFKACLIRRAFLFISNGKLCFYIYHFIPFTVWMIFVAISPFISPVTVPDRKDAIRYAILHAEDGDVIVLAGKGHEDYQEIKGVKHPMDERVLIEEIIQEEEVKAVL